MVTVGHHKQSCSLSRNFSVRLLSYKRKRFSHEIVQTSNIENVKNESHIVCQFVFLNYISCQNGACSCCQDIKSRLTIK